MDRLSKLRILGSVGLFALASACGCASPHWVMRDGNGGVVAIPENSNHWPTYYRQQADEMIKQVCPKGYAIDREEEVVVGQTVTTQRDTDNHAYDLTPKKSADQLKLVTHTTTETTSTRNVKEYQIAFHGNGDNH